MGPRQCHVCDNAASKYKCPSCLVPYCSLSCFKKHKEVPCAKTTSSEEKPAVVPHVVEDKPIYVDEQSEVLDEIHLQSIASCAEIRDALKSHEIQKLICSIDSSANTDEEFDKAMRQDVFRVFADKVLSSANR